MIEWMVELNHPLPEEYYMDKQGIPQRKELK
jgi:hypothetical protein